MSNKAAQAEYPQVKLEDILTPKQIRYIEKNIMTAPEYKRFSRLASYFETFSNELEAKGINDRYLAYVVDYQIKQKKESGT